MRMSRRILCAATAVLVLAACGGDDDAGEPTADEPAAATGDANEPADEPAAEEPQADASEPADEPAAEELPADEPAADGPAVDDNMASVTIDGTTYEVDVSLGPAPRCDSDFFAAFLVSGGDSQGFFYALLPPPGDPNHTDPPNVSLRVNDGEFEWIADPSKQMSGVEPGESQVDEFTVDGNTVSGTATFVELNETYAHSGGGPKAPPVTGTFEVSCAG
jgi:hypothetical protein